MSGLGGRCFAGEYPCRPCTAAKVDDICRGLMPAFSDNARRDGDGRYRFRGGRSVDPHEELHPEMTEQTIEVGANVPGTIDELIAMQQGELDHEALPSKPEKPDRITAKVSKVLDLIDELETSAAEDQQIALSILRQLENYHDDIVGKMQEDADAKHSQIVAWAVDADRLMQSRILLESVDLD